MIVTLLLACGTSPRIRPVDGLEADPSLGAVLAEYSPYSATSLRASVKSGDLVTLVQQAAGYDFDLEPADPVVDVRLYDPASLDGEALPPPPLDASHPLQLAISLARGVVGVVDHATDELAIWDGGWTVLPLPEDDDGTVVIYAPDRIAWTDGRVRLWAGDAWVALSPAGGSSLALHQPGPWDPAAGLRLVFVDHDRALCVTTYAASGAEVGPSSCLPGAFEDGGDYAINGSFDDFSAIAGGSLIRVRSGVPTAGGPVGTGAQLTVAPGSAGLITTPGADGSSVRYTFVDGDAAGALALASFEPVTACGCERATDPECGCIPHAVFRYMISSTVASEQVHIVSLDSLSARLWLQALVLDLPVDGHPFGAELDEDTDTDDPVVPQATIFANVYAFDTLLTDIDVAITSTDGGTGRVTRGTPELELSVDPNHTYELVFSLAGYHPLRVSGIVVGQADTTTDLGELSLSAGAWLGDALPWDVHPASTVVGESLVAPGEAGWWVIGAAAAPVTGIDAAPVAGTGWSLAPQPDPTRSVALVTDGEALHVVDLATARSLGSLPGAWAPQESAFAADAPVAVVRAPAGVVGEHLSGPALVLTWDASGVTALREIAASGWGESLSADGTQLLRTESGTLVLVDVGTGAVSYPSPGFANPNRLTRSAISGFGRTLAIVPNQAPASQWVPPCGSSGCALLVGELGSADPMVDLGLVEDALFAPAADALIWSEWGRVWWRDLAGSSSVLVAGPEGSGMHGAAAGSRFVVASAAGLWLLDSADGRVLDARGGSWTLVSKPDGDVVAVQDCATLADCDLVVAHADGSTTQVEAGAAAPRFGPDGRFASASAAIVEHDPSTGDETVRRYVSAGAFAVDPLYETFGAFGAPCLLYRRGPTGNPWDVEAEGLYCAR